MKKSYLFLAKGFEEIEAITTIDILRRAGVNLATVSITDNTLVQGAHEITLEADILFVDTDFTDAEFLILPGGMPGTKHLGEHQPLMALLKQHADASGHIAAICAAPSLLGRLGLLNGKKATCYPGFESELKDAQFAAAQLEQDDNLITANGPGAAFAFGIAIVEKLKGHQTANLVAANMMLIPKA